MKGTRVAYLNGEFLPEAEVNVSFRTGVSYSVMRSSTRHGRLTEKFSVLWSTLIVSIGHLKRCRSILEFLLKK